MRPHYIYILDELLKKKPIEAPANINGNTPAIYAWHAGYLTALEDIFEAFKSVTDKDSVQ